MARQLAAELERQSTEEELWEEYHSVQGDEARNALLLRYLPLVNRVAGKLNASSYIERDDLVSDGVVGLIGAIGRYDERRGVPFAPYAERRIRGEMLDGLRRIDKVSRLTRERARTYAKALWTLTGELGRPPTDDELMARLRADKKELVEYRTCAVMVVNDVRDLRDEVLAPVHGVPSPLHEIAEKDELAQLLLGLAMRDRHIIVLYHLEGLTMKEIGKVLKLSESRICQIYRRVMKELRARLRAMRR